MAKHSALALTTLVLLLAGCASQASENPAQPARSTESANPTTPNADCIMPEPNRMIGVYLSVFQGKEPVALTLAPGFTVPIKQANATYSMFVVIPAGFDTSRLHAKVESDTWQFMPNSGALRPQSEAFYYEFAVQPKDGTPKPGKIQITLENLREPGSGKVLAPITLHVFGATEKLPDCPVSTSGPAPSANPGK